MDIVSGSSFRYSTVNPEAHGGRSAGWTAWGRGATTTFSGEEDGFALDGRVVSGMIGLDYRRGTYLGGVLLSHSLGSGDFAGPSLGGAPNRNGEIESTMIAVHPYLRVGLTDRISAWGLFGRGWGTMTTTLNADIVPIRMNLGAVGARGMLVPPSGTSGFGIDLKSDAFLAGVDSERGRNGLPSEQVYTRRIRLVMEGSGRFAFGKSGMIDLALETGLRHDGGDAEEGRGLETGGRLRLSHQDLGLTIDASARVLLAHEDDNYEEWGAAGSIVYEPGGTGQGFQMEIRSLYGSAMGGAERLWSQRSIDDLIPSPGAAERTAHLTARLQYVIDKFGGSVSMTPYADVALSGEDARDYRLGWRVNIGSWVTANAERALGSGGGLSPGRGLVLRGSIHLGFPNSPGPSPSRPAIAPGGLNGR